MKPTDAARRAGSLALLGIMACGDGAGPPPAPASITIAPGILNLRPGGTATLLATVLDARGRTMTGQPVTWSTSNPSVVTVGTFGLTTAVGPGEAVITARSGAATGTAAITVELPRVARLLTTTPTVDLVPGSSATIGVMPVDETGAPIVGWPATWTSDHPQLATVSGAGVVQGVAAGSTVVRVRIDTVSAAFTVRVVAALDVALAGLSFAQVVQNAAGTVPLLAGGGLPVAVNVYAEAPAGVAIRADVAVECRVQGAVRWTASGRFDGVLARSADAGSPAVQFHMPNAVLGGDMACHADLVALDGAPDDDHANNRYPRTGTLTVPVITPPALEVAFVPVVLASDGNATGNVHAGNVEEYLITARQLLPLGQVNPRVLAPFTTTTMFANGTDAAWRAILRELDTKRLLDGFTGHYYGVLRPRPGITSVQFGGFAYIGGRTAVSIQVGWSSREAAARETVAHELGHNFGRPHAPCGGPAAPDPGYPYLDAGIGTFGWDVFAVRDDPSRPANAVPPDTKDLMSYCRPIWISDYNYLRMIAGRQALTGGSVGTSGRALLVRGEMDGHGIRLDPLFEVDGPIPLATGHGVEIEVVDAAGAMLSRARVPAYTVEHGSTQSFVGLVPLPPSGARGLRVTTPGGLRLDRPLDEGDGGAIPVTVERGAGTARIRWDARAARHALVRDAATGEVLALIDGGLSTLPAAASRPLSISFSTGGARFYRPEPR